MTDSAFQQCINPACRATYAIDEVKVACTKCGSLLDIRYDWSRLPVPKKLELFRSIAGRPRARRAKGGSISPACGGFAS